VNTQYPDVEKGHSDDRNGLAVVMEVNIKYIIYYSLLLSHSYFIIYDNFNIISGNSIDVYYRSETKEKLLKLCTPASNTQFTIFQTNLVTIDEILMENTFALGTIATLQQQSKVLSNKRESQNVRPRNVFLCKKNYISSIF